MTLTAKNDLDGLVDGIGAGNAITGTNTQSGNAGKDTAGVAPTLDAAAEHVHGTGGRREPDRRRGEIQDTVVHGADRDLGDPDRVGEQELDDAGARGSKEPPSKWIGEPSSSDQERWAYNRNGSPRTLPSGRRASIQPGATTRPPSPGW